MSATAKQRYKEKLKALYPNQTRYLGAPCKHGHDGWRFVNGGKCITCESNRKKTPRGRELALDWHKRNAEKSKEQNKRWHKENAMLAVEKTSRRRAALLLRTPAWADLEKIKEFYQNCPIGMEVDHIVPLQGKNVSGLHVHWNLQYLTRAENAGKGNRHVVA